MDTRKILFARYRLNHQALSQFTVYVLDFPYWDIIDNFLSVIAQNSLRKEEKNPFSNKHGEKLAFRRLNPLLVGAFPHIVQGFEKYSNSFKGTSGMWFNNRRMIALGLHHNDDVALNPIVGDMNFIIQEWLLDWVRTTFEKGRFDNELELFDNAGQKALEEMINQIGKIELQWKPVNASELWQTQQAQYTKKLLRLAYNALPSVLASHFVDSTKGQVLELQGKEDTQIIPEWSLIQSGGSNNKHLAVVSAPMTWRDSKGKKEGKFSYLLQFIIQTQAGSDEPWIAVYMSIRRWVTKPLKSTNFKRDVSVYLRLSAPWIADGQYSNTLIQLKLEGNYSKTKKETKCSLKWKDNPSSLIENLKGGKGRGLVDPQTLVENPLSYHNPSKDQYYVLHAEGMKYEGNKGHPVETGTALALRGQIMTYITDHLGAYLEPDTAMTVDSKGTLSAEDMREKRIISMYNHSDLTESGTLFLKGSRKAKPERRKLTLNALNHARDGKSLQILLASYTDETRDQMMNYVLKVLCLTVETIPDWLKIEVVSVESSLLKKIKLPNTRKERLEQGVKLQRAWREKVTQWEEYLSNGVDKNAHTLIFVELLGKMAYANDEDDWLKSAIRQACACVGASSQMLYNIRIQGMPPGVRIGEYSRIGNATYDLLLRQTALRYSAPSEIYALAGLDEDKAQELIVVGLYRHVTTYPTAIDYPLAVISYPDGRTEVILPDEKGDLCKPIPYLQAGIEIGRTFANAGKNKSLYNYYNEKPKSKNGYRLKRFAEKVLLEVNGWGKPSLILMEAEWRKWGLLPIGNQVIQKNALAINNKVNLATDLPNLRLLRIRDCGTNNETPQYVELREGETWENAIDADDPQVMTGVVDSHAQSPFTHYFSIGQQPDAFKDKVDNQALTFETSSANAHKHQRAIEFVPFFLQENDDELVYCRIAHFLRSSPAWRGGNISLPYPLHLAKTLIDDQLDVFEPRL